MKPVLLLNAFSLNMLASLPAQPLFEEISLDEARTTLAEGFSSAVGHTDTAALYADVLGMPVKAERVTIALRKGDRLVIGQYRGPRLPEGCSTLPVGATIQWLRVTI